MLFLFFGATYKEEVVWWCSLALRLKAAAAVDRDVDLGMVAAKLVCSLFFPYLFVFVILLILKFLSSSLFFVVSHMFFKLLVLLLRLNEDLHSWGLRVSVFLRASETKKVASSWSEKNCGI